MERLKPIEEIFPCHQYSGNQIKFKLDLSRKIRSKRYEGVEICRSEILCMIYVEVPGLNTNLIIDYSDIVEKKRKPEKHSEIHQFNSQPDLPYTNSQISLF